MFDEGALRAKYEAMGLDEDDIEILIAKKRKSAEAASQTRDIVEADKNNMKANISNEIDTELNRLSDGRKTNEGLVYAKAGKTGANIIRQATAEEKKAGKDAGIGAIVTRRYKVKPELFTFDDTYSYDTDTDKARKAAYNYNQYSEKLKNYYKERDELKRKLNAKDISPIEHKKLTEELNEVNSSIDANEKRRAESRWVELTDEDLAARQRARDIAGTGLDMESGADAQYQAAIDARGETAGAKKNKKAMAFRENVENMRDLNGKEFSVPFNNSAHLSVRMTNVDKQRGLFPITVTSNGVSQTFAVPFGSLGKFRNSINKWAGDKQSTTILTDSDTPNDMTERLYDAWRTGNYSRTDIPERLYGLKKGTGRGVQAYYGYNLGGMSQLFDIYSDYYNNPEKFKEDFAADLDAAEMRGQTLPEYYQYLAGIAAEQRENRLKAMQQGIVDTFDQRTGRSNNIDDSREAILNYLDDISQHAKRGNTRQKAEEAYNILKNISSGKPLTDEQDEALEKQRSKAVNDIRSDIRWGMKHENLKQRDAAVALMNTIREMQQYANNIENAEDVLKKRWLIDRLPDNIRVTTDGTILSQDNDGDWVPTGDVGELFGDSYLSQLPLDTLDDLDTIELSRGYDDNDNDAFIYDDGMMPAVTLTVPEEVDPELVRAWEEAYDELGGPEKYNAYSQFLNTDLDKLFHGRMGELPRELRFVDVLDDDGNPVLDTNGEPIRRPYIFMSGSRDQLEKLYGEKNVGSRKRNWRSKFMDKAGNIDMNKYLAWQNARIAKWLTGEEGAQFADRIAAIQDNLKAGGLTAEQKEHNRKRAASIVAAMRQRRLEESSRAKLAARNALRRKYAKFMGSLLTPDEGTEDLRPMEIRDLNIPVGGWRDIFPFGMYEQLNTGSADRDTKAMAALIARLRQMGKI